MNSHHFTSKLFFLFFLLAIPLLSAQAQIDQATELFPAPTGSYTVGTTSRYFIDEARDEPFTADTTDKRELMVQFWYPAAVEEGTAPAPYMPNSNLVVPEFNTIFSNLGIELSLSSDKFAGFQSHTFADAPISDLQPSYPVLIFSHGWTATPVFFSAQLEEMASHGYIVAGINHTYASTMTLFPDGHVVTFSDFFSDAATVAEIVVEDQIFMVNQLQALNADDPQSTFTGRLNLEQLGVFGSSLGGAAAALACYQDSRFKAGIDEDGFLSGRVVQEGMDQPFMFMNNQHGTQNEERVYQRLLRGPAYSLRFDGFEHVNFSDLPLWPDISPLIEASLIGDIDGLRSVQLTNAYVLAFFDKYLKGEDEPLLDGSSAEYPEVTIRSRNT